MLDAGRRRARRRSRRARGVRAIIRGVPFVAPLPRLRAFGPPRRADRRRRVPWSARPSAVLFACASMTRAWMMLVSRRAFFSVLFPIGSMVTLAVGLVGQFRICRNALKLVFDLITS